MRSSHFTPVEGLTVALDEPQSYYCPGDVLNGQVRLVTSSDTAIGLATVTFHGRVKSTIAQANGQSESMFRGHATLFELEQILYRGKYTHKAGTFTWQFSFTIPDAVEVKHQTAQTWESQETFSGTSDGTWTNSLPPTFQFADVRLGKGGTLSPMSRSSKLPILLYPKAVYEPAELNDPRYRTGQPTTLTVRTPKLTTGYANTSLTPLQRVKSLFRPGCLPKFTFELDVSYPLILQIHHPDPIPFVVGIRATTSSDLTTIVPSQTSFFRYPSVTVKYLSVTLRAHSQCRCPSTKGNIFAEKEWDIPLVENQTIGHRLIVHSTASGQETEAAEEAIAGIDLGRLCKMRITDGALGKKHMERPLSPSFRTPNVSRFYELRWKIELECCGERLKAESKEKQEVTVIGQPDARFSVAPQEVHACGDLASTSAGPDEDVSKAGRTVLDEDESAGANGNVEGYVPARQIVTRAKTAFQDAMDAAPEYFGTTMSGSPSGNVVANGFAPHDSKAGEDEIPPGYSP